MDEKQGENSEEIKEIPVEFDRILKCEIEDEMKDSYLDYSMSVIVGRALPDVRDGLKPVHRRILFAMNEMGMFHNKPFKKSARIVGEVLGKYHPHGDQAVYDSLVRMAQTFSLRYPLVQGQGNFGSIDGDSAASMRYTEARLKKISEEMLIDIDKNTVKFVPNFDESLQEPSVLPSKVPNLLVNGSSGIAVGMATNIPPHNMSEICDGVIHVIDNPEATSKELMEFVKGPDFPTGGIIQGVMGLKSAYKTGRGKIIVRANHKIEELKKDKNRIIINEIPYQVNKSMLIEEIANLVKDKKITGISDLRDESDRDGMRIVIELKTGANHEVVVNQLFKHSRLQITFGIILLSLVDNQPRVLSLPIMIKEFINHRQVVVRKRTEFDLTKAEDRAHILEGLIIALNNIDETVALVKKSKTVDEARNALISRFSLTEKQAQAILDMRLQRLTSLEQDKIKDEHDELLELIKELKGILADENRILSIIKSELIELKKNYGDKRKTVISEKEKEVIDDVDLIQSVDMAITISNNGYIKRTPLNIYKSQKRGGKGIIAATTREEDFVSDLFIANTHDYILFFTEKGNVHWKKVFEIPLGARQAKGTPIVNLLNIKDEGKVTASIPIKEFKDDEYLVMATKKGIVKKTSLIQYSRPRRGGIIAIVIDNDDELVDVKLTDGSKDILLATREGLAIRFNEKDCRPIGRVSRGVRGISLKKDDEVVDLITLEENTSILTVTENGYGKRTEVEEYRRIGRGGVGVINIQCDERNGNVVSVKSVFDADEIMVISRNGITIRIKSGDISIIGRNTKGVRIMRLGENDKVVKAAKIIKDDHDDNNNNNNNDHNDNNANDKDDEEKEVDDKINNKDNIGKDIDDNIEDDQNDKSQLDDEKDQYNEPTILESDINKTAVEQINGDNHPIEDQNNNQDRD
ncbi:MAG: DNA gyrase subunit A [Candidatus Woesearchaeota archaeon]